MIRRPADCDDRELRAFEDMVRAGFVGSDAGLRGRIAAAGRLAWRLGSGGRPVGIAGLKAPPHEQRSRVFRAAGADETLAPTEHELGWVYVLPDHRRHGLALELCRRLLATVDDAGVHATSRTDNAPMHALLVRLGFRAVGGAFRRGAEDLVLFVGRGGGAAGPRVTGSRVSGAG